MSTVNEITWPEWQAYFKQGKTPATYTSFLLTGVFIACIIYFRGDLDEFIASLVALLTAYGVAIDQIAHLLWVNGYKGYRDMTLKEYLKKVFTCRTHDIYGMAVCAGALFFISPEALMALLPIGVDVYFMVRVRFYH